MAQARWAYDESAQGGKKIAFGNTWVIAAIVMRLPLCSSPVALPVLFRLWRGKATASQADLAAQMLTTLTAASPAFSGGRLTVARRGAEVPCGELLQHIFVGVVLVVAADQTRINE